MVDSSRRSLEVADLEVKSPVRRITWVLSALSFLMSISWSASPVMRTT